MVSEVQTAWLLNWGLFCRIFCQRLLSTRCCVGSIQIFFVSIKNTNKRQKSWILWNTFFYFISHLRMRDKDSIHMDVFMGRLTNASAYFLEKLVSREIEYIFKKFIFWKQLNFFSFFVWNSRGLNFIPSCITLVTNKVVIRTDDQPG